MNKSTFLFKYLIIKYNYLIYKLDFELKPISRHYLGDGEEIENLKIYVAGQGK